MNVHYLCKHLDLYDEKHYTKSWTAAAPKAFKAATAAANKSMINRGSCKPRNKKKTFLNFTDQENLRERGVLC